MVLNSVLGKRIVNNRIDEKNSVAAETEVRNLEKYFPVVRILTGGSRSLIGVGRRMLKVRNCRNIGKAFTVCCCLQKCELWTRRHKNSEASPFKQHHVSLNMTKKAPTRHFSLISRPKSI